MALLARIEEQSAEERGCERFRLRLNSPGQSPSSGASDVTIHELSASGFLIETDAPLDLGAPIAFELPVAGVVAGEIVWSSGQYFGGQFASPLSRDVLNAALSASRVIWPSFSPTSAAHRASPTRSVVIEQDEELLPLAMRVRVIVGSSALLWAVIATTAWLVSSALG